jgi:hypothetical protein
MEAHVLSTNDFKMPKVFSSSDSAYVHIVYLLLLEPGKFQSHPNMGVGIRSRYRFNTETNFLQSLQSDITNQINAYLPELATVEVSVNLRNNILGIIINTETGTYAIAYNTDTDVMDAAATYILEQL